jgi:hypothetical protein
MLMQRRVASQNRITGSETIPSKVGAWTEVVGTLEDVANDSITVLCTSRITLSLKIKDFRRLKHSLHLGQSMAVLTLDDGTVRVRVLNEGSSKKL